MQTEKQIELFKPDLRKELAITIPNVSGAELLSSPESLKKVESMVKPHDQVLMINKDNTVSMVDRVTFLPAEGYLMHFNIAKAKNRPHIEPLPNAHNTISMNGLCMVENQKQYVLEMEAAVVGVLKDGKMQPMYLGTIVDFGDRTPRVDNTGRTFKTWTKGVEYGGSTGMSTTWVEVKDWEEIQNVELEYWITDELGETLLHTPNASADTLKLWGKRLGDWVGNYDPVKLEKLGITEGVPFLLSTGQILLEDDGARSIDPREIEGFIARGVMKIGEGKQVETKVKGQRMPRTEETFFPTEPPFSYYS